MRCIPNKLSAQYGIISRVVSVCLHYRISNVCMCIVPKEKPTIKKINDVEVNDGEDATFTAEVAGKPTPKVDW